MMRFILPLGLLALAQPAFASDASASPQRAILILDASGSMWGKVDGKPKIEIAREVVRDLVEDWNPELHLGLMTYGHRTRGDCNDIELLIPPGKVDKAAFLKAVNGLTPRGKTPLTDAVKLAAKELRSSEEKATVILVSDGVETCNADPCTAAEKLEKQGLDFTTHVVGFNLAAADQKQIRCLADKTGGLFLAANDAASLKSALKTVVQQTVEPAAPVPTPQPTPEPTPTPAPKVEQSNVHLRTLLTEGGEEVKSFYRIEALEDEEAKEIATSKQDHTLKPGAYLVTATWEKAKVSQQIEVPAEAEYKVDLVYGAGTLSIKTHYTEGGEEAKAFHRIFLPTTATGQRHEVTATSKDSLGLPAGKYVIQAELGKTKAEQEVEIKAGEATVATINLQAGVLQLAATIGASEKAEGAFYTISKPGGIANPEPKQVAAGSSDRYTLPVGKYLVKAAWGRAFAEQEVEIKAGELASLSLPIQGGLLVIKAQDASGAAIKTPYTAVIPVTESAGLSGDQALVTSSTDQHRLPPGKYRLEAKIGDQKVSAEAEVKVGERTEVTLKP